MYAWNQVSASKLKLLKNINCYSQIFSVYPSPHDKTLQVQIGNNTGSLPDLSSVHFPAPPQNTNGQDGQQDNNNPVQSNEMNSYTSNSSYLSPTGTMDKHLSTDYIISAMNTDIKSPKDSSSQVIFNSEFTLIKTFTLKLRYNKKKLG
jgi:hypothetical protein